MPEGSQIIFLKEQAEQFVQQAVLEATGTARKIPFDKITGQTLLEIKTFGKELLFCFPEFSLRVHLMLFGKYAVNGQLNRELKLGLTFETGEINFYACDCRFIPAPLDQVYDWRLDVMHPSFDPVKAQAQLYQKPGRKICDALLDQNIMAGVGNGIKNEALYLTSIHPESLVGEIPETRLLKLIRACVTLSSEYLNWIRAGAGNEQWLVYKQKICPRDKTPLRQDKTGKLGRTGYFCDKCQHLYLPEAI